MARRYDAVRNDRHLSLSQLPPDSCGFARRNYTEMEGTRPAKRCYELSDCASGGSVMGEDEAMPFGGQNAEIVSGVGAGGVVGF